MTLHFSWFFSITCKAVAKSGILAPANLNIEASSRMECRAEKDDKIDKTWKVDQPCSFGTVQPALELLKSSLAEPVNWFKRPRNSKLFSNVFVYACVQLFMPHVLPYQTICWSGAFQRYCLIRQPLSDILGPCCWPQCLPSFSRLPKYLQISSPQMSNEYERMIMKAILRQCFF